MAASGGVVTQTDIERGLRALGLGAGETVFFHGSLSSLGYVVDGADAVIDALLAVVGPGGTVVAPTFVLTDRVGEYGDWWQPATTPSSVGLITEVFRQRPASRRSDHPIHSVAAIGPAAAALTGGGGRTGRRLCPWQGSFDVGSPFDYLHEHDARYLLLGVGFAVQTFCHFVETLLVERALRRARAVDPDLVTALQGQVGQVFRVWGAWPGFDRVRMGEHLESIGIWRGGRIGQATVRLADIRPYVAAALAALEAEPTAWFDDLFLAWYAAVPGTRTMPAGPFVQGSLGVDPEAEPDERPQRLVDLGEFFIDRYPVTIARYTAFVAATGHRPPADWTGGQPPAGRDERPVTSVAWDDALAYATWAGRRLPTEAEWEKAARGGVVLADGSTPNPAPGRRYPWGDRFDRARCLTAEHGGATPPEVGRRSPAGDSPYGVADLAGLVWEWVADWYDPAAYRHGPDRDPRGPATGRQRVLRGGEAAGRGRYARCASRTALDPGRQFRGVGFRCAWTPPPHVESDER